MLYILAGASNSGKSIHARHLTKKFGIPHFPLDLLTSIFSDTNTIDISHADTLEKRSQALWKFTQPLITHLINESENYLLEGDAILPHQVLRLQNEFPKKILACFLGYVTIDPEKKLRLIRNHEHLPDSWTHLFPDDKVLEFIKARIEFSKELQIECQKHSLPYIEVEDNLDNTFNEIKKIFSLK